MLLWFTKPIIICLYFGRVFCKNSNTQNENFTTYRNLCKLLGLCGVVGCGVVWFGARYWVLQNRKGIAIYRARGIGIKLRGKGTTLLEQYFAKLQVLQNRKGGYWFLQKRKGGYWFLQILHFCKNRKGELVIIRGPMLIYWYMT